MIYLYGVTEAAAEVPDCPGLEDQALRSLHAGGVGGLYTQHATAAIDPSPEAAWRHDRVLEAAMRSGPVLPARFGTTFAELPGLGVALERQQAELQRRLEDVRGCVELAVRVALPPDAGSRAESGRDYLREKLARRRRRETVAERTLEPLSAHAVRAWTQSADPDSSSLRASFLVRADDVANFAAEVEALAEENAELSLSCTGPWAPYSFVESER